jgi:ketosteroid isomerase-like protein
MGRRNESQVRGNSIAAARAAFVAALGNGDATAAAAVYAKEARLLPPAAEVVAGRDGIEAFWQAGIESGISAVALDAFEVTQSDSVAYEIGSYELRLAPPDGEPVVDRGKYLLLHERQTDGSWLRAVEMFNPDSGGSPHRAALRSKEER